MMKPLTHSLLQSGGVAHGFFTRSGGVSGGIYDSLNAGQGSDDHPENVRENRRRIAGALSVKVGHLLSLHQIHSDKALIVDRPIEGGARPQADGLVTQVPGLAISALSADCGPVMFYDPHAHIIGAAHAGWRGAVAGITDSVIEAMESLGARRGDIRAVLGPCISQINYEVGPEFYSQLIDMNESYDRFFALGPIKEGGSQRKHFDLKGFILARLEAAGLSRIAALPDCTYGAPERFFSYRYNAHQGIKDYGRNISAICLRQ